MSVSTTYQFQNRTQIDIPDGSGATTDLFDLDLVSLANGGVAVSGHHPEGTLGPHTDYDIFNGPNLTGPTFGGLFDGTESAIDQLTNGALVIATSNGNDVFYSIVGTNPADSESLAATNTSAPDVAGLNNGGFVIAGQFLFGGADNDIALYLRSADGSEAEALFYADVTTANDQKPSVCALKNGGFAVVWTREQSGGETETWYAIYEDDGTPRKVASLLDNAGTVNRNVQAVALDDGGFGVVYEDNGWSGGGITVSYKRLSASGSIEDETNVRPGSDSTFDTRDPSATVLSNGLLVVTYSVYTDFGSDRQIFAQLIEPEFGTMLLGSPFRVSDNSSFDDTESSAAGYGDAQLMVGWETGGTSSDGSTAQLVRTSASNAAGDLINGDDAVDIMIGAAGFDQLKGFDNNDVLNGGTGIDTLVGGKGNDILTGGRDPDLLIGAQGKDIFVYTDILDTKKNQFDAIADVAGKDRIDLSLIDANVNKPGDQKFDLVVAFTGKAGQLVLTFHTSGGQMGNTTVEMDVNGDSAVDAMIVLNGDHHDFTRFVL